MCVCVFIGVSCLLNGPPSVESTHHFCATADRYFNDIHEGWMCHMVQFEHSHDFCCIMWAEELHSV